MARIDPYARRSFLKKGLIGVGATAAVLVGVRGEARAAVSVPSGGGTLKLSGRGFHSFANDARIGAVPEKGDRYSVYGELLDVSGAVVGEFASTSVTLDSPFQLSGEGRGSLDTQTLTFRDGAIVGVGAGGGLTRSYAIVGGTGRFAGARGTYTATLSTYGLGGDGSAEFDITFLQ